MDEDEEKTEATNITTTENEGINDGHTENNEATTHEADTERVDEGEGENTGEVQEVKKRPVEEPDDGPIRPPDDHTDDFELFSNDFNITDQELLVDEGADDYVYKSYDEYDFVEGMEEYEGEISDEQLAQADTIIDDDDLKSTPSAGSKRQDSFDFVLEVDMEEAKEESTITEEATPPALDRLPYFERFMEAMNDYGTVKRLNNFLHKKMADYFKKRKMDHVLIEVDHPEEALIKYGKKLDSFAALKEVDEKQRREMTAELTSMRATKDHQCKEADDNFKLMLEREAEVGVGLISAKTGKEIPEKFIEKLINNQRNKAKELQQLRLTHIKIRNAVAEKNAAIRALDKIGDNYTLIEFEQLKIENQGHIDKIEERDDELTRLRKKCQGAIQCLAHVREKCSASEQNIRTMRETLIEKEAEKTEVREEMNRLKQERDYYRLETQRLKEENGLLTKDKLLIDMENAMKAITELEELNQQKRENLAVEKEKLTNLKKHYERELRRRALTDKLRQEKADGRRKSLHRRRNRATSKYFSDRASFLYPKLEDNR